MCTIMHNMQPVFSSRHQEPLPVVARRAESFKKTYFKPPIFPQVAIKFVLKHVVNVSKVRIRSIDAAYECSS